MSDLLSLLNLGANGIAAQNRGVGVASNNVANVNTAGYSRQRVDLEALQGTPHVGGVRAGENQRVASSMLAERIRTAGGGLAMARAFGEALSDVEHALVGGGATIDQQLGSLYARFSQVSATPADSNARDAAISAARDLAAGIRRRAGDVETARNDADARIRSIATRATSLAQQLAATNQAVATSGDGAMLDKRDDLARQLVELTGGKARIDGDGQMRFVLDGGAVLVDGNRASTLATTPDPATGLARVSVVDGASKRDVTGEISSGTLGGELAFRDRTMASTLGKLDQLAYDVATTFNTVHAAHAGLDGVSGRPMFTPPGGVAGAAKALELDPALAANSRLLATAAPGTGPGDNTGARALFDLSTSSSLAEHALGLVGDVANARADAKADVTRGELVGEHLTGLRDSLSGVDIQEEMTNLARFEHASNALVKFVSTIDDMLGSLIAQL